MEVHVNSKCQLFCFVYFLFSSSHLIHVPPIKKVGIHAKCYSLLQYHHIYIEPLVSHICSIHLTTMGGSTFWLLSYLLCALMTATVAVTNEFRTVNTKLGQIRGIRKTSLLKQTDFYSFKGIPYAKSPTGELRFKVS